MTATASARPTSARPVSARQAADPTAEVTGPVSGPVTGLVTGRATGPASARAPLPPPEAAAPRQLATSRLILRRPTPRDLAALTAYYATPRSVGNGGPRDAGGAWRTLALHLGQWQINGTGMFALTLRGGDDSAIGLCGAWFPGDWPEREIGWMIFSPRHEGKGLAYEAARAALDHAFVTLGWPTAVSYIRADNLRSQALAERLGARLDPDATPPPVVASVPIRVYRHSRPQPRPLAEADLPAPEESR